MKTILTKLHEIIFKSELKEVLGFTNMKNPAGTHSTGKPTIFD